MVADVSVDPESIIKIFSALKVCPTNVSIVKRNVSSSLKNGIIIVILLISSCVLAGRQATAVTCVHVMNILYKQERVIASFSNRLAVYRHNQLLLREAHLKYL